jgi:hypothetical protein
VRGSSKLRSKDRGYFIFSPTCFIDLKVKRQPGNQAKETHLLELAVTMRCLDTAPQPESWLEKKGVAEKLE